MTAQSFEILCPVCRTVVPPEASGCPTCASAPARRTAAPPAPTPAAPVPAAAAAMPGGRSLEEVGDLSMKEYHRFVKRSMGYGGGASAASFGAWLPALLLLLVGLVAAAAFTLGWL